MTRIKNLQKTEKRVERLTSRLLDTKCEIERMTLTKGQKGSVLSGELEVVIDREVITIPRTIKNERDIAYYLVGVLSSGVLSKVCE